MNSNLAFQEEIWDELIDGEIVAMSPRPTTNHIHVSGNIYRIFADYLDGKRCTPFPDGADLYLTEKDRFVPDGMIVCDPNKIKNDGVHGAPDLVVEVLSSSTAKRDRVHKKNVYEKAGVKEYWIVNPADKSVEQYLLVNQKFILNEVYVIHPDYVIGKMSAEEKAAIITEFKCSLYDDLIIKLEDIFRRTI